MNTPAKNPKDMDRINLRLPPEVFASIDQARSMRIGHVSRNTWIAEAIQEKLARELGSVPVLGRVADGGGR